MKERVLVRGGGDLATAVIQKLYRSGFSVVVCELKNPKMVRRTVSFANAVYEGAYIVEEIEAVHLEDVHEIDDVLSKGKIPVVTADESEVYEHFKPKIFVDATLSKKKVNYYKDYADIVIGLGPNIEAGKDAHAVIETSRGHDLGRLILSGFAKENTHIPGEIGGYTHERVLHSPCDGTIKANRVIGDFVSKGDVVLTVDEVEVKSKINGVLRGLIHESVPARKGLKIADVDPRGIIHYCFTISDKGRNIAGGVLEAILMLSDV